MDGPKRPLPTIGWREWVALPDFDIRWIKVKVDTGARSSSLHAFDLDIVRRRGVEFARFSVHPIQRNNDNIIQLEAKVLEMRSVRSSTGHSAMRPVIETRVSLLGKTWPIELTLANRDEMGFRMLLGRQAIRDHFLVDPGRSFYSGRPARRKKKKKQKKKH